MNRAGTRALVAPPRFFTPGVLVVATVAAIGALCWLYRFAFGLGASTNLSDAYPWGIWIGIDVACGVALAAGGFTSAFIAHLLHREAYHAVVRPALLTAAIGYTFVALGVMTDLGRFWAMWHVMLPGMWQPNSVLFEVAICVMCYLTVLYIEFLPVVCERFMGRVRLPGAPASVNKAIELVLRALDSTLAKTMTVFVILGVLLSCMHQSSLGTLMVIAGDKLHPLWQSPFLPLMFLLSAFAVGYPMVIFESVLAHRTLGLPHERRVLSMLARFTPILLAVYLGMKVLDLLGRGVAGMVLEGTLESRVFIAEISLGVIAPMVILSVPRLRRTIPGVFVGATLVIVGVAMNRLNVFIIAYTPSQEGASYTPSWMEIAVSAGFIAMMVLIYRLIVLNLPVIERLDVYRGRAVCETGAGSASMPSVCGGYPDLTEPIRTRGHGPFLPAAQGRE